MKKTDRQLGMDRDITRRDFIHDISLGITWADPACRRAGRGAQRQYGIRRHLLPADPHRHARLPSGRLRSGARTGA